MRMAKERMTCLIFIRRDNTIDSFMTFALLWEIRKPAHPFTSAPENSFAFFRAGNPAVSWKLMDLPRQTRGFFPTVTDGLAFRFDSKAFSLREPVESGLWEDHAQPPAPFPNGSRFSRLLISINQKEIKTLFTEIIKDFFKFGLFLYFFNLFIYLYFLKVY